MSIHSSARFTALSSLGLLSPAAFADYALNFQPPITEIATQVYDLHMLIFWVCVAIALVVFGVMFYSIFAHRKSKGFKPAQFHHSTFVEIVWTTVPFVILIAMAIPATKTLIAMEDTSDADMNIKITASQFKWEYDYIDDGFKFISALSTPEAQIYENEAKGENYLLEVDNPIVIPTGQKVRFLLTAQDVLHAWWVPAISVKKDAVPGFINEMWTKVEKPGIYRGQCAELCGAKHGFMPIVLEVKSPEDYATWLAGKKEAAAAEAKALASGKEWTLDEMMAKGETVYGANCAVCHQGNGEGLPPTFPALKGSKLVTEGTPEAHTTVVVKGQNAMPAFASLNDLELAAVITYERNAWGNDTKQVVQPSDVKALR
jgi:cytochrome c oxidase subunit 2